jgi:hypothetical protein
VVEEFTAFSSLSARQEHLQTLLRKKDSNAVIFQFKNSEEWSHLEEYVNVIGELLDKEVKGKLVVLLAHNSSFDKEEKKKFKFPFIHFMSTFKPITLDILGEDKSDYRTYYNLLDKRPVDLLENDKDEFMAKQIEIALIQEFITGKPFHEADSVIEDMKAMISSRGLLGKVFADVIRQSKNEDQKEEGFLDIDKPIVDIVEEMEEKSEIVDIIETMKKNLMPLIHQLLMKTVRAVHKKCDLFFGLRLFKELEEAQKGEDAVMQENRMKLWESIAKNARLNVEEDDSDIKIYTDKDSRENPQVFYRNLLKNKEKISSHNADLEEKSRAAYRNYEASIEGRSNTATEIQLRDCFMSSIKEEILPYLENILQFSEEWTKDIDLTEDLYLIENLLTSVTTLLNGKTATFQDAYDFIKTIRDTTANDDGEITLSTIFRLVVAVLLVCPEEVEWFAVFKPKKHGQFRLRLALDMQEIQLKKTKEGKSKEELENFANVVFTKMKMNEKNYLDQFITKLKAEKSTVLGAKLDILKTSLEGLFKKFFKESGTFDVKIAALEQATTQLKELIKITPKRLTIESTQESKDYAKNWIDAIIAMLRTVRKDKFDILKNSEYDPNTFFNVMVLDPIRVLAQFICQNVSLEIPNTKETDLEVKVETQIPSLSAKGSLPTQFEKGTLFLPDILLIIANEVYGCFYHEYEKEVESAISSVLRTKESFSEHRCLQLFYTEVKIPSEAPCIYVPGVERAIELCREESPILDVWILAKLALLNSVMENSQFGEFLQIANAQNENFIIEVTKFLTGRESSYDNWKLFMQAKLYHVNRAEPISVIENVISDCIEHRGDSIEARTAGFIHRIHNALSKSKPTQGMILFAIPINPGFKDRNLSRTSLEFKIEDFLEILVKGHFELKKTKEIQQSTIDLIENDIRELHAEYGRRHSLYHFLEYLWIKTQELAIRTDLSSEDIIKQLAQAVKDYQNEDIADKTILHLPFVGKNWTVNPTLSKEQVEKLYSEVESSIGNAKYVWEKIEDCAKLASWILLMRDLFLIVLNAGDKSIEETKVTQIKTLIKENSKLGQTLASLSKCFDEICKHEEISKSIKFESLTLHQITSNDGILRQILQQLVKIYNEKLEGASKSLKSSRFEYSDLSSLSNDRVFSLSMGDLVNNLSQKYWGIDKKKKQMLDEVAFELREELLRLALIKDDVTPRAFVYSDTRVDKFLKLAKEHPLWNERPQAIPLEHQRRDFIKKLRQAYPSTILRYENSLFTLLKQDKFVESDDEEIVVDKLTIRCPFQYLLYTHRLLLLKKLHTVFYQNKAKLEPKRDDILVRLLNENEFVEKNYALLAAIAENRDEQGIIKLIYDSKSKTYNWKKELIRVESVKEAVEDFNSQESRTDSLEKFILGDICAASFNLIESEFQKLQNN